MNFLADSARTSLELPYTTLAQRRLAEQIVADDKTLQCERCDFEQEQWLHIFKQSSRGSWYGSRPPGMPPMVPAYSRPIPPTPNWKKTYSANRGAGKGTATKHAQSGGSEPSVLESQPKKSVAQVTDNEDSERLAHELPPMPPKPKRIKVEAVKLTEEIEKKIQRKLDAEKIRLADEKEKRLIEAKRRLDASMQRRLHELETKLREEEYQKYQKSETEEERKGIQQEEKQKRSQEEAEKEAEAEAEKEAKKRSLEQAEAKLDAKKRSSEKAKAEVAEANKAARTCVVIGSNTYCYRCYRALRKPGKGTGFHTRKTSSDSPIRAD